MEPATGSALPPALSPVLTRARIAALIMQVTGAQHEALAEILAARMSEYVDSLAQILEEFQAGGPVVRLAALDSIAVGAVDLALQIIFTGPRS